MIQQPTEISATSGVTWCGPYAFAVLTGRTYDVAEKWLRKLLHRTAKIRGMYWDESSYVCEKLGWKQLKGVHTLTFNQLRDHLLPNRQYLVAYTRHFVVVDTRNWTVTDNQTGGWVSYDKWSKRKRVKRVWQTTKRQRIARQEK